MRFGSTCCTGRVRSFAVAALLAVTLAGCSRSSEPTGESAASASAGQAGNTAPIPWRHDYDAALAEGKKTGKPILIDFSATWCPPCQEMVRRAWPDPRVSELASTKYIPLALDVDDAGAKGPARRYNIETIPAILVVNADGGVIRQSSFMPADDLAAFLRQ